MKTLFQSAMIIDDDVDLSQLLAGILEKRKFHVWRAHSLKEAANYLDYLKPSVIFLDNSFPEGLGVNFIRTIKTVDDEIKIVMITGDSSHWVREKAAREGISYFLKKPFNKKVIDVVLDDLQQVEESPNT